MCNDDNDFFFGLSNDGAFHQKSHPLAYYQSLSVRKIHTTSGVEMGVVLIETLKDA